MITQPYGWPWCYWPEHLKMVNMVTSRLRIYTATIRRKEGWPSGLRVQGSLLEQVQFRLRLAGYMKGLEEYEGFGAGVWPARLHGLISKEWGDGDEGREGVRALLGKAGLCAPWGEVRKEELRASPSFLNFFTLFPAFPGRVTHLLALSKVHETQTIHCGLSITFFFFFAF